jgi:hypothetical protein
MYIEYIEEDKCAIRLEKLKKVVDVIQKEDEDESHREALCSK